MAFHTDIGVNDVITLECEQFGLSVTMRLSRRSAGKVRLSIDADDQVTITKQPKRGRKPKCTKKKNQHNRKAAK
jgi:hypothetical protein